MRLRGLELGLGVVPGLIAAYLVVVAAAAADQIQWRLLDTGFATMCAIDLRSVV